MKIYCFDRDACTYTKYLNLEELEEYNLEEPFIACPECNELAIVVNDAFSIDDIQNSLFTSYLKLMEKEKNDQTNT